MTNIKFDRTYWRASSAKRLTEESIYGTDARTDWRELAIALGERLAEYGDLDDEMWDVKRDLELANERIERLQRDLATYDAALDELN